jgi:hypothetical protein
MAVGSQIVDSCCADIPDTDDSDLDESSLGL